jgi:phosphatidylserine/phosphatidylglycerophosphate/cardiolipin synthase-like enzyme
MTARIVRVGSIFGFTAALLGFTARPAQALERLCDPAHEDCRAILLNYIRLENVGIDVGFWFMEDARFTTELIKRFQAGVPVRVIMDTRANNTNQYNAQRLAELQAAGIPMRRRTAAGIMHYKLMLFAGQGIVEFSGANFSADAWVYTTPYVNYVDESVYFTNNPSFVHSFMAKFDDLWTSTSGYTSYANVSTLLRNYGPVGSYVKDPQLNFPPAESYATRALGKYAKEMTKIDVIMYRITDRRHTDAMIAAKARGVPVRVISDPQQYRDASRLWDAYNIDRMYMANIPIKMRAHAGLNHQKLVLLYGQHMSIFGSSNWTESSDLSQEEHNCFCTDGVMFQWFEDMFERKWNNTNPVENSAFTPLQPDKPVYKSPANGATGIATNTLLKWYAGPWAHKYDVYLGTNPASLSMVMTDKELGPSDPPTQTKSFTTSNLLPGTTYYWKVVSRTKADRKRTGDVWSFTTAGTPVAPPSTATSGAGDIVVYGGSGRITGTAWSIVADSSAAGAKRLWNRNAGAAKLTTAYATPSSYVEFTINAVAGKPYHLWIRGKAEGNVYTNDSVFVQFSNAVASAGGAATYRIGTTSAAEYTLENCSGCGLSGWGWQDNAWGLNLMARPIYFDKTGLQTIRIQSREDGLSIDQILLSPALYLNVAPGNFKNDTLIFSATQ